MGAIQTADMATQQQRVADVVDAILVKGVPLGTFYDFDDRDYEAIYSLGYNLYTQGRYDEAVKVFGFLTFYNHLERKYLKALAACQQMLKQYDVALQTYAVATVLDISDPEPTLRSAECLIGMGMLGEAREALNLVVEATADGAPERAPLRARAEALLELLPPEVPA